MSHYRLEGSLKTYLCRDCWDFVSGVQVLLYRHRDDQNVEELISASAKRSFALLTEDQVQAKQKFLVGRGVTDEKGEFSIEIKDEKAYQGGPLEVDVRVEAVKGEEDRKKKRPPLQFTISSVQPNWSEQDNVLAARWEHYISARHWCHILELRDVWVICGRVVSTGSQAGLQGMKVRAFDRDWLQDDLLGEDTTDNNGVFHIYYTSAAFKRTPFSPGINVELVSGPDLYFDVEDSGGNLVIDEQPSEGRHPPRENVGHCYCETLEVGDGPPFFDPWFTHVGNFHIITDINSVSGKTNSAKDGAGGVGWGFFGSTKLRGFCPKTKLSNGLAMFYRFKYVDPLTSTEKPVTADLLTSVLVGSKLVWWDVDNDTVFGWTTQSVRVAGAGATPPVSNGSGPVPDHIIVPNADGWIAVDQDALDGGFYGPLIRLDTSKIVSGGGAPGSGAGTAPADPKVGAKVKLIYETTTADSGGAPDPGAINTQAVTVTVLVNNWQEVRQLGLLEFETGSAGACTGLTSTVTIKYTVNHELVADWSLGMSSAASPWTAPVLPNGNASVAATHPAINVATWPPCSYIVSLSSRRALTDGETNDSSNTTSVTFCKT